MKREFTATIYILQEEKVLLIYHQKLQKWLPPGGHLDPGELPHEAAIREAEEETGLKVALIPQENIWVERQNATSIYRPYLTLLEEIPQHQDVPAHQHVDQIYVGYPIGGSLKRKTDEIDAVKWWTLEELEALQPEVDIFTETLEVIRHLFKAGCYV